MKTSSAPGRGAPPSGAPTTVPRCMISPVRAQTAPGETVAGIAAHPPEMPEPMAAIFLCLGSLVHGSSMSWRGE